jgi:CRP-like cAMP-binding protein
MKAQIPELLRQRLEAFTTDSGISREIVDEVISHYAVVTYPKDSTLVLQKSPADFFSWFFSGRVEVFCRPSDSSRILVRLCRSGDVLAHVDFIVYQKRRVQAFEAFARAKYEVVLVTREHIFKLLQALESEQFIGLLEYLNTAW